jgi:hypothetical protein
LKGGRFSSRAQKDGQTSPRKLPNMNHLETLGEILAVLLILAMGALLLAL